MSYFDYLIDRVIARAIDEISSRGFAGQIVTFALYFEQEGAVLSVCADTLDNSLAKQEKARNWSYQYLSESIDNGDLAKAALFNHSVGRSLSLGDFTLRNLAEHALEPDDETHDMSQSFFVALAQGLHRNAGVCLSICDSKQPTVLACSTHNDEVGLMWTPPRD